MNIAVLHNYYQHRGGEDTVFEAESRLLRARGHHVVPYTVHNDHVHRLSSFALAVSTVYNRASYNAVRALLKQERIDIMHCHNTLPILSPSVYFAANDAGVPVVQTLHNYRLLCPNALFFRNGGVCEECLGKKIAIPAVLHKCYRQSRAASSVVAGATGLHHALGTWRERIARYIVLTEFARQKFIQGGVPAAKLVVKPNFAEIDENNVDMKEGEGGFFQSAYNHLPKQIYAVYLGRLSEEKGIMQALQAWERLATDIPHLGLYVIGAGPLEEDAQEYCAAHHLAGVHFIGQQPLPVALNIVRYARFLLFPSLLYETFGKAMVEAFACGTPVIASRLGALAEIVEHGRTGFHVEAGDVNDIVRCSKEMLALSDAEYQQMRQAARQEYEQKYTARAVMERLEQIYSDVVECVTP